jgi:hypothetical protein
MRSLRSLKTAIASRLNPPRQVSLQEEVQAAAPRHPTVTDLVGRHGVFESSAGLASQTKIDLAMRYAYEQRAEIAMVAASTMYSGGDYFEFGSDGLGTFRNFLTAADLHGFSAAHPDMRFYAFDIFGDEGTGSRPGDSADKDYFSHWRSQDNDKMAMARKYITDHGLLADRCILKQGYFQDTLSPQFKAELAAEQRKIGFAFLDCNITSSYVLVFDFILDLLVAGRAFVYMDEYFVNGDVPPLFDTFAKRLRDKRGLVARYMRNAGGFGALYCVSPEGGHA